jgi:DNA repair exonuclease SbcCD nuclease subunit
MRFLHTADWQLGMTRHFLGVEAQARFTAARTDAIRTIGSLAAAEGCSFVVVAGDVFESNHVERQVVVRALEAMSATPQVTFYLLPGNHDPLDASSVFRSPTFGQHQPGNVVVLADPGPVEVQPGVEVVAAPWFSKRPLSDLVDDACRDLPVDGTTRIVVGHGAVDALAPASSNPALVSLARAEAHLAAGTVHYVALGDRHSTTDLGHTGRVWYSGAPEPTDHVETDPGNALVVELSGGGATVTPHHVGAWRFLRSEFDLMGAADLDALAAWLDAQPDKDRTIVRLALVGQLSLSEQAALDDVLDHHRDLFAAVEVWAPSSDLVVLPDDGDFAELDFAGFARAAVDDLRVQAVSGDSPSADRARDALGLLYRLGSAR